jgi:undecaprenyl phosphate-alpha-L-ara4FN deformylase
MISVGLRIDVDTLRGTRIGVSNLISLLGYKNVRASFFFSVGPDNMGRHLWRLLRPTFLNKMFRTGAAKLYGWDILLRGTLSPGPVIGKRCAEIFRAAADAGHEVGLHAWDHHKWQTRIDYMDQQNIFHEIQQGYDLLSNILKRPPDCFAAPAWRCTPEAFLALEKFQFRFQSNCRGYSIFRPTIGRHAMHHLQIPTTLPTYDELIGVQCCPETYNDYLLSLIQPDSLNVLTIHAEVEGISCFSLFQDFLNKARQREISFVPLGDLLNRTVEIEESALSKTTITGRDGWISCQEKLSVEEPEFSIIRA